MKKALILAIAATAITTALVIPSLGYAGRVRATITMSGGDARISSASAGAVGFDVSADVSKESDLYKLWVANKCSVDGTLVSAEYKPVQDGYAGDFTVASGMDCTAYVWMFPSSESPLRGASMSYHVD